MKKLFTLTLLGALLLTTTNSAFATNHVSQMATTKGGQHVAECAQKMDHGVSDCTQMLECEQEM